MKTPWHAEWEAAKKDLKLRVDADSQARIHDMHKALERYVKLINDLRGEAEVKKAALAKRVQELDDTKSVEATVQDDTGELELRRVLMERDADESEMQMATEEHLVRTRELMHWRLERAAPQLERKHGYLASCVVEATEDLFELKERLKVACAMQEHSENELEGARRAFARQRAQHEDKKATMRARLTKLGAGKQRASALMLDPAAAFGADGEVDPSLLDPATAAAYEAAMVAMGELPPEATEEERAAAKQAVQDALRKNVGHVMEGELHKQRTAAKPQMTIQEAWMRLCALTEAAVR